MIVLPRGLNGKQTLDLSAEEMAWLAMGETILQKLGLTLACVTCLRSGLKTGAVLQGANDVSDPVLTVTCGCRRLQWRQRAED